MKILFFLIDGLGDVNSFTSLRTRDSTLEKSGPFSNTPLQKATLPILDSLANIGLMGLLDPVKPGLACGSDTAHLSIFGYDPFK